MAKIAVFIALCILLAIGILYKHYWPGNIIPPEKSGISEPAK